MTPRIETLHEKKLVGRRLTMSFADYKIGELWRTFSPRRKEINNNLTNDLISLVIYKSNHFTDFKPTNEFERWAAVEVSTFDYVPTEMETIILQSGLYAVFDYKGLNTDNSIFQNILGTWLPTSDYDLDSRDNVSYITQIQYYLSFL
jgi:AraC family transcriptional regulator